MCEWRPPQRRQPFRARTGGRALRRGGLSIFSDAVYTRRGCPQRVRLGQGFVLVGPPHAEWRTPVPPIAPARRATCATVLSARIPKRLKPVVGSNPGKTDMREADASHALLTGAGLTRSSLGGPYFQYVDLRDVKLNCAPMTHANFTGARSADAIWIDGNTCTSPAVGSCNHSGVR